MLMAGSTRRRVDSVFGRREVEGDEDPQEKEKGENIDGKRN